MTSMLKFRTPVEVTAAVGLAAMLLPAAPARGATDALPVEEIVVTAELRDLRWEEAPTSVTLLDRQVIERQAVQHVEELVYRLPNVNLSRGTSRARFFQIRGVGRREEYTGAPNQAVGVQLDDIDLSGLGGAALLFDVEQVEVLRGPQSTQLGANASAGLIRVNSRRPTSDFQLTAESDVGNDDLRSLGVALGGPLGGGTFRYRLALQQHEADGFRDNRFLGLDDSNGRDEFLARLRVDGELGSNLLELTLLHADLDNGYDAFAVDNGYDTFSDRPGRDAQLSRALSLRWSRPLGKMELVSVTTVASHEQDYAFDGDWGNPEFWGEFAPYDFFSDSDRERRYLQQDLRLSGALGNGGEWLLGGFLRRLDEDYRLREDFNGALFRALDSRYEEDSLALYGEVDLALTQRWSAFAGGRVERREADYRDDAAAPLDLSDTRLAWKLGLRRQLTASIFSYLSYSRGFRFGGFNVAAPLRTGDVSDPVAGLVSYDGEDVDSVELGLKGNWLGGRLTGAVALFSSWRDDFQELFPTQLVAGDPLSFQILTRNGDRADSRGLEAEFGLTLGTAWRLDGALGLLDTDIERFAAAPGLEGRELPHAPSSTAQLGLGFDPGSGWFARLDVTRRAAFYFDSTHDRRADSVTLVNGRLGYRYGDWELSLWGHNLGDERYAERGFFFGNEPPDFVPREYLQLSDRRAWGLNLRWSLAP